MKDWVFLVILIIVQNRCAVTGLKYPRLRSFRLGRTTTCANDQVEIVLPSPAYKTHLKGISLTIRTKFKVNMGVSVLVASRGSLEG